MNKFSSWEKIGRGRKMKSSDNIVVISLDSSLVPLFCSCCHLPMRTIDDTRAFHKSKVCYHCDLRWTNSENECTPNKSSPEWVEYISLRQVLGKPSLNFK